jgi:hypothetical protein
MMAIIIVPVMTTMRVKGSLPFDRKKVINKVKAVNRLQIK